MAVVRYAVRRAKNRAERAQGKRWIAQAEFPGGRKIVLDRSRTRPPAVQKVRREARNAYQQAANAGAAPPPTGNGGGGGGYGRNDGGQYQERIALE